MNTVANPSEIKVLDTNGSLIRSIPVPEQIRHRGMPPVSGYEYEWQGYEKALREGLKECPEIPNSTTLSICRIMNEVFRNAGIEFPF